MKLPLKGECLCRAVQVSVNALPLLTLACHCRGCQKLTASAYSMTTMVPKDAFACTGALVKGGLGSPGRNHYFCKSCLNFIYSEIEGADYRVNLRTSVLHNAALFPPFVEVMTDEKLPWGNTPAVHSYARHPQSQDELKALMADYAAQFGSG